MDKSKKQRRGILPYGKKKRKKFGGFVLNKSHWRTAAVQRDDGFSLLELHV